MYKIANDDGFVSMILHSAETLRICNFFVTYIIKVTYLFVSVYKWIQGKFVAWFCLCKA